MAAEQVKPWLLVDVDGVISLWGFPLDGRPAGTYHAIDGLPHFLSEAAARHLLELAGAFDLAWCTGWEEKADEHLPGLAGVPAGLPHLSFDRHVATGTTMPGHWKLGAIDAFVGDRPAAWIDDAFNDACHAWAARRAAPTLLVETTPEEGLIERHRDLLLAWSGEQSGSASG